MARYSQEEFIKAVKDIAKNGWHRSILPEEQKNWSCGQIMSRLPDKWVKEIFQAAVEGVDKEEIAPPTTVANFLEQSTQIIDDDEESLEEGEYRDSSDDAELMQATHAKSPSIANSNRLQFDDASENSNHRPISINSSTHTNDLKQTVEKLLGVPSNMLSEQALYNSSLMLTPEAPLPEDLETKKNEWLIKYSFARSNDKIQSSDYPNIAKKPRYDPIRNFNSEAIIRNLDNSPTNANITSIFDNQQKAASENADLNPILTTPAEEFDSRPVMNSLTHDSGLHLSSGSKRTSRMVCTPTDQENETSSQDNNRYMPSTTKEGDLNSHDVLSKILKLVKPVPDSQIPTLSKNVCNINSLESNSSPRKLIAQECSKDALEVLDENDVLMPNADRNTDKNTQQQLNLNALTRRQLPGLENLANNIRRMQENRKDQILLTQKNVHVANDQLMKLKRLNETFALSNTGEQINANINSLQNGNGNKFILYNAHQRHNSGNNITSIPPNSISDSLALKVQNLQHNGLTKMKLQQATAAKRHILSSGAHPMQQQVQTSIPLTIASANNDQFYYNSQQINNRLNSFKSDGNFSHTSESQDFRTKNHSQALLSNLSNFMNIDSSKLGPTRQLVRPEPEYLCPVAGCGKSFRRKAYVKKHMELHSNHKAYGCDLCDVRCRQYAGLYIHYKGVHKMKLKKSNVRYYEDPNTEAYTQYDGNDEEENSGPGIEKATELPHTTGLPTMRIEW